MTKIEGISIDKLENDIFEWKRVKFTKVTLIPSQIVINNKRELYYPILWEHPRDMCEPFDIITVKIKK